MRCSVADCGECGLFNFENRAEYDNHCATRKEWKCVRHTDPESVLSETNQKIVWTSEPSGRSASYPNLTEPFFGSSGFIYGNGYKAYACDFPVGTRIRVTAEVLPPE